MNNSIVRINDRLKAKLTKICGFFVNEYIHIYKTHGKDVYFTCGQKTKFSMNAAELQHYLVK